MMLEVQQKQPEKIPDSTEAKIMINERNKSEAEFCKSYVKLKKKKTVKQKYYACDNFRQMKNIYDTEIYMIQEDENEKISNSTTDSSKVESVFITDI